MWERDQGGGRENDGGNHKGGERSDVHVGRIFGGG